MCSAVFFLLFDWLTHHLLFWSSCNCDVCRLQLTFFKLAIAIYIGINKKQFQVTCAQNDVLFYSKIDKY